MAPHTRAAEERKPWALRLTEEEKEEIRRRAQSRDLTMTEYMVKCALGELDADAAKTDQRIGRLEDRIAALERMADVGAFG